MTACRHHVIVVAAHNGWCVICCFELGWRQTWFDLAVVELFKLVVEVLFEGGLGARHVLDTLQGCVWLGLKLDTGYGRAFLLFSPGLRRMVIVVWERGGQARSGVAQALGELIIDNLDCVFTDLRNGLLYDWYLSDYHEANFFTALFRLKLSK